MSGSETGTSTSNIARLSDAERHRILVEWNNTARPYPSDKCVHELVEAHVEQSPTAVAAEHDGR